MNKEFRLKTIEGEFLKVSTFGLGKIKSSPCLILVHGFKGFKDWGFFPYTAKYYADRGFFVLAFNFSHNGIGESELDFTELKKFAENTVSLEVSELVQVIDAYRTGFFGDKVFDKICLIGHSRGAGVVLLSSLIEKVDAYIVWAALSKFDRYTERQKIEWRKQGYFEVINSRTNQIMKMNVELLEDVEVNKSGSLNIENAVRELKKPLLIVHGEQDLTVPLKEGEQIYNWSDKSKSSFQVVYATGHTFNIIHPFEGSNKKFDGLLVKSSKFLSNVFKD